LSRETDVVVRVAVVYAPAPAAAPRRARRPLARRARAALLWGVAGFVLFQLGLALAIEGWLPELRDPHYAYKARRLEKRLQAGATPSVVMLGSSRTVFALRGQSIEKDLGGRGGAALVFNFGVPGAGPVTELLVLKRLLARGVRPGVLLLEVLPPVLAGQVVLPELQRLDSERLWWSDLSVAERYVPAGAGLRSEWWRGWPLPAYTHRFPIVSKASPALLPHSLRLDWFRAIDDSGWVPPPWRAWTPEGHRQAVERTRQEYSYYLDSFRLGGPSCRALRELLELCRQVGIPTTLVLMPEGSEFRGWYTPAAWQQVEAFLAELRREYGVAVVNARDWSADSDFSDSHHLLPAGADRFSVRLGREVIAPLLEQAGRRTPVGSLARRP
jgi:hypothetical protein